MLLNRPTEHATKCASALKIISKDLLNQNERKKKIFYKKVQQKKNGQKHTGMSRRMDKCRSAVRRVVAFLPWASLNLNPWNFRAHACHDVFFLSIFFFSSLFSRYICKTIYTQVNLFVVSSSGSIFHWSVPAHQRAVLLVCGVEYCWILFSPVVLYTIYFLQIFCRLPAASEHIWVVAVWEHMEVDWKKGW